MHRDAWPNSLSPRLDNELQNSRMTWEGCGEDWVGKEVVQDFGARGNLREPERAFGCTNMLCEALLPMTTAVTSPKP